MQDLEHHRLYSQEFKGAVRDINVAGGCTMRVERALDPTVLARVPALWELAEQTGSTPLLQVTSDNGSGQIFAKAEWLNLGGTVKARTALGMLHDVFLHKPAHHASDLRIRTYSGGSMHVTIAGMCRALGLKCRVDSGTFLLSSQIERIRALGTELVLHDKEIGFWSMVERARELAAAEDPDADFLFQHEHPANLRMHRQTTGMEIVEQLGSAPGGPRRPDAWIAAIGTGGTLIGCGQALATLNPGIRIYGVTPAEEPYGMSEPPNSLPTFAGSGAMGYGRRQPFVARHEGMVAGHFTLSYSDALQEVRRFAELTGIRIGTSAAANWLAARHVARRLGREATVVTIFPSLVNPEEWQEAVSLFAETQEPRTVCVM